MAAKHKEETFKKWLDRLQQESWQLELIISGVAIFGLFQTISPLEVWGERLQNSLIDHNIATLVLSFGYSATILSVYSLISCLLIHITLRGLWIGAVGLRYFSGDIDYERLGYSTLFKKYLQRKVGGFDKYIARLEDYCSLMFALSFLLVFFFISFFTSLVIFILIGNFIFEITRGTFVALFFKIVWSIIGGLFLLLTAIDFFSQGFLKRKAWLSKLYLPVYKVMSRVTLSFLYRPLLYNLLDNKMGKRIIALLLPVFILGTILTGSGVVESNYHNRTWEDSDYYANNYAYVDELIGKDGAFVGSASIPSRIIKSKQFPLFIKHRKAFEDAIYAIDSTLIPSDDNRGYNLFKGINLGSQKESHVDNFGCYTGLLSEIFHVSVDDMPLGLTQYLLISNFNDQRGYETLIDASHLSEGLHTLKISHDVIADGILTEKKLINIPFWYYPE